LDPANLNRFEQIKNPMIEKEISKNLREMGPKKKKKEKNHNRKRKNVLLQPTSLRRKQTDPKRSTIRPYPDGFELKPYPNEF